MAKAEQQNAGSGVQGCRAIARRQHGVLTREQVLSTGLSEDSLFRRVRNGEFLRLLPGVFAVASSSPTWEQRLMAAQLWIGSKGVLSHRSAAALLRLDGFLPGGSIDATVMGRRAAPKNSRLVLHHDTRFEPGEIVVVDGFRITNPSRTLLDLAAVVTETQMEIAIEDAFRRHLSSVTKIEWVLATRGGSGRRGSKALRKLIAAYGNQRPTDSSLEVILFRLLRGSKVPLPVRQHEVWHEGRFLGRIDLAYPDASLAIEADGFRWHSGRGAWRRDTVKWNDLVRIGWRIYKVTPDDLRDHPQKIVQDLRGLLGIEQLFD